MTQDEAKQLISEALENKGYKEISYSSLVMSENTIRAAVKCKHLINGSFRSDYKELLVLRTAGQWRVLI